MRANDELSFLFGAVRGARARDVAAFVGELPVLSRGSIVECDLGVRPADELFAGLARFRGAVPDAVRARLEFWAWRIDATLARGSTAAAGRGEAPSVLALCDSMLHCVPPRLLRASAVALLAELPHGTPAIRARLAIRVDLGAAEAAGIALDRTARTVFLPSPLPLPPRDEVILELAPPGGEPVEASGIVMEAPRAGSRGPGAPAGLVVALPNARPEVLDLLEAHTDPARRSPRYPVRVPARLSVRGEVASPAPPPGEGELHQLEDLSQGGAFVRTALRLPCGTPVDLGVDLPGGGSLAVPAVVVRTVEQGLGLRFEADAAGEAEVARAIEEITRRPRRALVVDDDNLGRRMMGDALAERGFEVFASSDGQDGLKVLIEQLLELDVLVTDLRMPGLDGEQLLRTIRGAGGEQDLAIVVVSGDVDVALEQRLLAAGADAVLPKAGGTAAVGEAAERAVLRRRCGAMAAATAPA